MKAKAMPDTDLITIRARALQAAYHYQAPFAAYLAMARQEAEAHEQCFDVEDYRADLVRRRDALLGRANDYREKYARFGTHIDLADCLRCMHKADGIDIALGLLPRKEA